MYDNPAPRYTRVAIILHWLVAALVITNVVLAWTFGHVPDAIAQPVTDTHKSIGIITLGLVVMRILWRIGHRPPDFPKTMPRRELLLVRTTHLALYFMIVAMPLSGWIYDSAWKDAPSNPIHFFGLFDMPRITWIANMPDIPKEKVDVIFGKVHVWLSYLLYFLFTLHVAGALKRQFRNREPELQRMTF